MGFYEELGVRPVINAAGSLTRLGGNKLAPGVLDAMREASVANVHMGELQAAAGKILAEITGAEAGYVVSGAAAGLTLAAAACMAGMDPAAMDQLPDTTGLKNEIVVQRGHRNAYDHAIRASGAKFVEAGYLGYPGAGGTYDWQIEAAISERTAAVAWPVLDTPGTLSLPEVAEIAHAHGLPVIVDASASLPPRSNLRRFIAEGADLVTFSGGKAIGGPQASGVLVGRAHLIASVAFQHQDMDVRMATWAHRERAARGEVRGIPHQGLGRGMKTGREEIAGLVTALKWYAAGSDEEDARSWQAMLDGIAAKVDGIPGVTLSCPRSPKQVVPYLWLELEPDRLGFHAYDAVNALLKGDPAVAVAESRAEFETLIVNPMVLDEAEAAIVGDRLRDVLMSPSGGGA